MNFKDNKKLIAIILIGIGIIMISISSMMVIQNGGFAVKEEKKNNNQGENKEVINKYVAYLKINPSIKLEYTEKCIDDKCEEPIVNNYELVNDDAKEIFKDIDLMKNNNLKDVLNLIYNTLEEKNISFSKVYVYSDYNKISNYLEENSKWTYETNTVETNKIDEIIAQKEQEEIKEKEETLKKTEQEIKQETKQNNDVDTKKQQVIQNTPEPPKEEKTNTRNDYTIYLSDGVTYSHGGIAYCCDNCFTEELINEIKNAKGYYVTTGNSNEIDFRKINNLSGNYNTPTFYGNDLTSKLTLVGGDPEKCDHGGLGGGPEPLTKEICNQYHLTCE